MGERLTIVKFRHISLETLQAWCPARFHSLKIGGSLGSRIDDARLERECRLAASLGEGNGVAGFP